MNKTLGIIVLILGSIGAINWGLVGAFNFDLVAVLFGPFSGLSRIIYILVGISGLALLFGVKCFAKGCSSKACDIKNS